MQAYFVERSSGQASAILDSNSEEAWGETPWCPRECLPLFLDQHGSGSTRSRVYTAIICEHTEKRLNCRL